MEKEYSVKGMHCAACKANVENAIKKNKNVVSCEVNLVSNSAKVIFNKDEDKEIFDLVKNAGYELSEDFDEEEIFQNKKDYKRLIKIIFGFILLIPLIFIGMGGMYPDLFFDFIKEPPFYFSNIVQYVITFIIIAMFFDYYKSGFLSLKNRTYNMDSLVFLGSFFSLIYSIYLTISTIINYYNGGHAMFMHFHLYLDSASMILVIVSLGKYIEDLSKNKAKSTIRSLLALRPKIAHIEKNGEIIDIPTKNIQLNDVLIVKPGETIPSDGIVLIGTSSVDESILTGESLPITKKEDDYVIGGSVNKEAMLKILVNKTKKDNVLNQIANLVKEASNMKTPLTKKVDQVSKVFVPIVMSLAVIVFIIRLILGFTIGNENGVVITTNHFINNFDEAFTFGVGVLVISCPCALGLATPISLLVGSSVFSKNYILVQKSEGIEKVKDINCLVLDKTNTITEGELTVSYKKFYVEENKELLDKIYTSERYSEHPIAKAISSFLKDSCSLSSSFMMNETLPGSGLKAVFNNEQIYITNLTYQEERFILDEEIKKEIEERSFKGEIPILIYNKDNKLYGIYYLKDKLKKESKDFIKEAKKHFDKIILLTGDNKNIASYIAKEAGIDEIISEVKPVDKDKVIEKLQNEGYKVMMVGDGVNDSIALTRSDVGVSVAKGSDIAIASASFILMRNNLNDILKILSISKRIRNNISFNLFWAFIYNIVFIPIAAGAFSYFGVILEPMYCSILMAASSLTVCLNALTLFIKAKNK